jgi:N-acyl-D-aspartate/D-glutamate deacylase
VHDLLIRGAQVFDGQGNPPVIADVAIDQGKITAIGQISGSARETVQAAGLALMPGIVDLHTHYDAQITWDKTMSPSPALGVTTTVIGNCGFGIAPCPADLRETMLKNLSVVEGMDLQALLTGVNWGFETFGQYMDQIREIGPYLNTAVFAGHSVIRTAVMGDAASEQVEPTPAQMLTMRNLIKEAMDAGAIGFASSFSPNHSGFGGRPMPSTIASENELRELTNVLGEYERGVFMMATGSRASPAVMESIAHDTGRPTFISTVLGMYNEATPERAMEYYEQCAAAQARGNPLYMLTSCQPLSFDFSLLDPYILLSHTAFDAIQGKDVEGLKKVYADPAFRAAFRENLKNLKPGILFLGNWSNIEINLTHIPEYVEYEGLTITQVAEKLKLDPLDAFFDIAIKDNLTTQFVGKFFNNNDEGVAPLLKHSAGVVTLSDAGAHLIYMCDAGFGLHFLGHWVRETGHFTLQEGIRRLTSHPADCFKIAGRGRLLVGAPADLLLFDPVTVGISRLQTSADLPGGGSRMVRASKGVHGVWVNGVKVHDGQNYVELERGPGDVLTQFDQ